jgi:ribonuclease Z
VVFSGDTRKPPNLAIWAKSADVLVHEAQSQRMRAILAEAAHAAGRREVGKILDDIESYHSSPVDAEEVANDAGVRLLVLPIIGAGQSRRT